MDNNAIQKKISTYWSPKSSNGGSNRTKLAATLENTQTMKITDHK